jgi:hypothetical protein
VPNLQVVPVHGRAVILEHCVLAVVPFDVNLREVDPERRLEERQVLLQVAG